MVKVSSVSALLLCIITIICDTKCLSNGNSNIPEKKICPKPKPCYTLLKYGPRYRCIHDEVCPEGYKCCRYECYIHSVCIIPVNERGQVILPPTTTTSATSETASTVTTTMTTGVPTTVQEAKATTTKLETTPFLSTEYTGSGSGDYEIDVDSDEDRTETQRPTSTVLPTNRTHQSTFTTVLSTTRQETPTTEPSIESTQYGSGDRNDDQENDDSEEETETQEPITTTIITNDVTATTTYETSTEFNRTTTALIPHSSIAPTESGSGDGNQPERSTTVVEINTTVTATTTSRVPTVMTTRITQEPSTRSSESGNGDGNDTEIETGTPRTTTSEFPIAQTTLEQTISTTIQTLTLETQSTEAATGSTEHGNESTLTTTSSSTQEPAEPSAEDEYTDIDEATQSVSTFLPSSTNDIVATNLSTVSPTGREEYSSTLTEELGSGIDDYSDDDSDDDEDADDTSRSTTTTSWNATTNSSTPKDIGSISEELRATLVTGAPDLNNSSILGNPQVEVKEPNVSSTSKAPARSLTASSSSLSPKTVLDSLKEDDSYDD